jgi:hypothetical protein
MNAIGEIYQSQEYSDYLNDPDFDYSIYTQGFEGEYIEIGFR